MEFIIEVGTEPEQQLIRKDLDIIRIFAEQCNPPLAISQVIVPQDFKATVNKLLGISGYRAVRGESSSRVEVTGKIVPQGENTTIVFSPTIYRENNDQMVRSFLYLHETMHVLTRRLFPQQPGPPSFALGTYHFILYHLYDEYYADRSAYGMVESMFTEPNDYWKAYIQSEVTGCGSVVMDKSYYEAAQTGIEAVLTNGDIVAFLEHIRPLWDEMTTIMAHFYALFHQKPELFTNVDFSESAFINQKTIALMGFYKEKFDSGNINIDAGIELVIQFMTNFGFLLEDQNGERHVQVNRI